MKDRRRFPLNCVCGGGGGSKNLSRRYTKNRNESTTHVLDRLFKEGLSYRHIGIRGSRMDAFATVEIPSGTWKYVLIRIGEVDEADDNLRTPLYLVRGVVGASYHSESARPTLLKLKKAGIRAIVEGGGRICRDDEAKTIHIYGHSIGFPWKDGTYKHFVTKELCEKAFPDYKCDYVNSGY